MTSASQNALAYFFYTPQIYKQNIWTQYMFDKNIHKTYAINP